MNVLEEIIKNKHKTISLLKDRIFLLNRINRVRFTVEDYNRYDEVIDALHVAIKCIEGL